MSVQNVKQEPMKTHEYRSYHRTQMRKELVIHKLREQGCRITKQRLMLLDIILEEEYSSCKEIYFKAVKMNDTIGTATVYRMINTLESIGAISRNNMYRISCGEQCEMEDACLIELDDNTTYQLSAKKWNSVILAGLKACGYVEHQGVRSIVMKRCDCEQ
ncbi:MAG: transcriptional repressor [bacterium]|nr:transcriptional repressor [bacterium]